MEAGDGLLLRSLDLGTQPQAPGALCGQLGAALGD